MGVSVGHKQADYQERKLETTKEKSQPPKMGLLHKAGIHVFLAHVHMGTVLCGGPGAGVFPECVY